MMNSARSLWRCALVALCVGAFTEPAAAQFGGRESAVEAHDEDLFGSGVRVERVAKPGVPCRCVGDAENLARIKRALAQPLKSEGLEFRDQPLHDAVAFIRAEYGLPLQLDAAALNDNGVTTDEPVTLDIRRVSVKSALLAMLDSLQLTYVIANELVVITTPEVADERLVTCVYDVRDLAPSTKSVDALMDAVTACIAPESWAENGGGEAEVRPLRPGLLVVSQTFLIHEQIAELLSAIRAMQYRATDSAARPRVPEPDLAEGPAGDSVVEPTPAEANPFD